MMPKIKIVETDIPPPGAPGGNGLAILARWIVSGIKEGAGDGAAISSSGEPGGSTDSGECVPVDTETEH